MLCEEPGDISMLMLKILKCCTDGNEYFIFYVVRVVIGLTLDLSEGLILMKNIFNAPAGAQWAVVVPMIAIICGLVLLGGYAIRETLTEEEQRRRKSRFFVIFKTIHVLIVALLSVGVFYSWEEIDIMNVTDGSTIFLLVSLGIDVAMDPIEMIIGYCVYCNNEY